MKKIKLTTNINCSGCVKKVTPAMNEAVGENNWEVELSSPSKTLTVNTDAEIEGVIAALEKAGYTAEKQ